MRDAALKYQSGIVHLSEDGVEISFGYIRSITFLLGLSCMEIITYDTVNMLCT